MFDELRDLFRLGNLEVGNHTMTHRALSRLDRELVEREIIDAQNTLLREAGIQATSIAYPYGYYNQTVIEVCQDLGFKYGFTTEPEMHRLDELSGKQSLTIGRFGEPTKGIYPAYSSTDWMLYRHSLRGNKLWFSNYIWGKTADWYHRIVN